MRIFISSSNIPIGYVVPKFPSIFWPLGAHSSQFHALFLYYARDMWKFTFYWTMVLFCGFYFFTGLIAGLIYFRNKVKNSKSPTMGTVVVIESLVIVFLYTSVGILQGVICGSIVGLLLLSVYKAGELTMSTWIPFVWAIAQILFNICSSYLLSLVIL